MVFKIGDKVKIIGNSPSNPSGVHCFNIGEVVTIHGWTGHPLTVDVKRLDSNLTQIVLLSDIEKIKKPRVKKVKVGDRVRIIGNSSIEHFYQDWDNKPVFVKIVSLPSSRGGWYGTKPIEGAVIGGVGAGSVGQQLNRKDFELAPILLPTLPKGGKVKKKIKDGFECENCGFELNTGDEKEFDDIIYCEDCFNDVVGHCEHCEDNVLREELILAKTRNTGPDRFRKIQICENCLSDHYFTCEDCDEIYHINENVHTISGRGICTTCCDQNYFACESCGEIEHCETGGDGNCRDCFNPNDNGEGYDGFIHNYNYKPEPTFYRGEDHNDKLFMGVELELEVVKGYMSNIAEEILKDPIYCKTDGSLDNGFEIVTHPCTLSYHKNKMKWDEMLKKLIANNCKSHDTSTCGLHIHVSKKALSHIEAIRLGIFVNLNCQNFETLARRTQSHYSKFKFIKKGRSENKKHDKDKGEYLSVINNDDRYEALNYQNHSTIEFRLYKGTLKYHTLISTIELTHAVCYFVKQVDSTLNLVDKEKGWNLFMEFVKKQCKTYPNLIEYLQAKGLLAKSEVVNSEESQAIEV